MLIEAGRLGCTREVLVIVAALSMQDPRERPPDKQTQADQSHARFKDEHSDFMSLLNLWAYLREQQKALSHSAFRRMCRNEFLHYLRVREWQDLHSQLRKACQDVGIDPRAATSAEGEDPNADVVHQALLAGLLSHVGLRDEAKRDYLGARGARFGISPGSTLVPPAADLRHVRRARRDDPAVGAHQRPHRPGLGRTARPAPGQAHVLRAAVVAQAGCRPGHRAGHPVRRAAGRGPYGQLRADQRRGVARPVHPARAGGGRLGDPPRLLPGQPGPAETALRARGARPAP